ncbi:MAG: hypothetical protein ACR65R_07540 [Methylomicrobium sp.]
MEGNETIDQDIPLMAAESRVKDLERKAIAAYRAAYPDGPPWQDLHKDTRFEWLAYLEKIPLGRQLPNSNK